MANEEQLEILKRGVDVWNRWRVENPRVQPELREADLRESDLREACLSGADLSGADLSSSDLTDASLDLANLRQANLARADLLGANLDRATLTEADLSSVDTRQANLRQADLSQAILSQADLSEAKLGQACLMQAVLRGAALFWTDLTRTDLYRVDLSESLMGWTSLGDVDLSKTIGLETVRHEGPSMIGIDTIYRSKGNVPEVFLRGAGVPENFIAYMKSLAGTPMVFEYYSSFISYATKDQEFADLLRSQMQSKGARVWLATEDLKIGDRFRARIDEAIRLHDKLLLVLSEDSVKSPWVEAEVEAAFEKERRQKRSVLFPIRLDDVVMETEEAWAAEIRRTRHIGDFRKWKDHDEYQKAFGRLMRDLTAEDKVAR